MTKSGCRNPKAPLHDWNLSPKEAVALQRRLAQEVRLQPVPKDIQVLAAADIGYVAAVNRLAVAIVAFRWPGLEPLENIWEAFPITFPYVPGLLSFREAPAVLATLGKLKNCPDLLLCDGQGIAHPRKFGLASHLGLWLGIPTIGCAKKLLCGEHAPLGQNRGDRQPLTLRGEEVGCVFRSRDRVKPLYISPGHLADMESSITIIRSCLGRYRIPEPLRQAHNLATLMRTKLVPEIENAVEA